LSASISNSVSQKGHFIFWSVLSKAIAPPQQGHLYSYKVCIKKLLS